MKEYKEGDLVLCTVDKISDTTVFVKIEGNGEGTIVTSEIAPGRIRNLRDYVVPGKKIVCKVLYISQGNINLSLRRVIAKEKKEVMEKAEKEKNALSILKSVIKEKSQEIVSKIIEKEESLSEFFSKAKLEPKILNPYFIEEQAEKILKIISEKKEKVVEVKKEFNLICDLPNGLSIIKKILMPYKENITYISAGKYSIKIKAENYKEANHLMSKCLEEIENNSKKENAEYELLE